MSDLNAFLKGEGEAAPAADPAPIEAPREEQQPERAAAPEAPREDEAEPEAPRDGEPLVPRRAYEDERRKRQDHKAEAARLAGELAEVRRQMEEFRKAPPAPPPAPPAPPPFIDPAVDPHGFAERMQQVVLNERLNTSEMLLRREIGAEQTDAAVAEFKAALQERPHLIPQMYAQPDPYGWMHKQVQRMRAAKEVGDDPAAYRSKIEAEVRARLEQEYGQQQQAPRVSPAAGMPPSLANARSAAPRSAPAFTGPPPLDAIFKR